MTTKEELYELALEMAKKYYSSRHEKEADNLSALEKMDRFTRLLCDISRLEGFCDALLRAGIFEQKEVDEIYNFALGGTDMPPKISEFIKGLKELDAFKSGEGN